MDAAQWPEELGLVKPMEDLASSNASTMMACPTTSSTCTTTITRPQMMEERKPRPQKEQPTNCPRCNSTNTKFCYYNNYSLTQPRYFCKSCRRYWTEGGTLRSVPVGGGSRKNKRHPSGINSSVTSSSSSAVEAPPAPKKLHVEHHVMPPQDLNLAFNHPGMGQFSDVDGSHSNPSAGRVSAMELLRSEMAGRPIGNYIPMQLPIHHYHQQPIPYGMQPGASLGFSLDGVGSGSAGNYGNLQGVQERNNGRLLFPFEQLKPAVQAAQSGVGDGAPHFEQNRGQAHEQDPPGFWQGMLSGGDGSW